jgi:hypothetical protein
MIRFRLTKMEQRGLRRHVSLIASELIFAIGVACHADNVEQPTLTQASQKASETRTVRPKVLARIDSAMSRVGWIGAFHNDAVREAQAERPYWYDKSAGSQERWCGVVSRITEKYAALALAKAAAMGLETSASIDPKRAVETVTTCRYDTPAKDVGFAGLYGLNVVSRFLSQDATVDYYGNRMIDSAQASTNTGSTIHNAVLLALDDASDYVTQSQFDILVANAAMVDSSAATWAAYQQSGGFGPTEVQPMLVDQPPTHLYSQAQMPWFMYTCWTSCKRIYKIDALGCLAGAVEGGVVGCGVWGIAGSVGATL